MLELTLLASLSHLSRRHVFHQNFHLAYSSYRAFHSRQSIGGFVHSLPFFSERAALAAFESLLSQQHLIVWSESAPVGGGLVGGVDADSAFTGRTLQRRFLPVKMMIDEADFRDALKQRSVDAPTWLVLWANNRSD